MVAERRLEVPASLLAPCPLAPAHSRPAAVAVSTATHCMMAIRHNTPQGPLGVHLTLVRQMAKPTMSRKCHSGQ